MAEENVEKTPPSEAPSRMTIDDKPPPPEILFMDMGITPDSFFVAHEKAVKAHKYWDKKPVVRLPDNTLYLLLLPIYAYGRSKHINWNEQEYRQHAIQSVLQQIVMNSLDIPDSHWDKHRDKIRGTAIVYGITINESDMKLFRKTVEKVSGYMDTFQKALADMKLAGKTGLPPGTNPDELLPRTKDRRLQGYTDQVEAYLMRKWLGQSSLQRLMEYGSCILAVAALKLPADKPSLLESLESIVALELERAQMSLTHTPGAIRRYERMLEGEMSRLAGMRNKTYIVQREEGDDVEEIDKAVLGMIEANTKK